MGKKQQINLHDKFFKSVFSRREEAIDFLKGTLDPKVFSKIKKETIKLTNSSYVSKELRKKNFTKPYTPKQK